MWRIILYVLLLINFNQNLVKAETTKKLLSNVYEVLGYSSTCVASALTFCEHKSNISPYLNLEKPQARNCHQHLANGDSMSGVRVVYPYASYRDKELHVYCDQTTDGGGWTVIQNRNNVGLREDFNRSWWEYVLGFGKITGEFWLGLDNIHSLVNSELMELRIDLEDYDGAKRFAKYGAFYVQDSSSKYILRVGRYSGDAGDSLKRHNSNKFSTYDQDNDLDSANCAEKFIGGWWFKDCFDSNLNGHSYIGQTASGIYGINWKLFRGWNYSLKKVSMKVRPAFLKV